MKWTVACPHCGKEYDLDIQHQGKQCRCAVCQQVFICPEDLEKFTLENAPAAAPPTRAPNKRLTICRDCGAFVSKKAYNCPACGGKVPLFVPWYKNLFCGIIIFLGAILMLLALATLLLPSRDQYGRRSDVIPCLVGLGIGAIFFFGGGAIRRQR